jgi:hypothetical protein
MCKNCGKRKEIWQKEEKKDRRRLRTETSRRRCGKTEGMRGKIERKKAGEVEG